MHSNNKSNIEKPFPDGVDLMQDKDTGSNYDATWYVALPEHIDSDGQSKD